VRQNACFPARLRIKALADFVDTFLVMRAARPMLVTVRLAVLAFALFALAGCGGEPASRTGAAQAADECVERWNAWAPSLQATEPAGEMLDRTLRRIENPVTVIARRGDDPDSAYCGVVLWLTRPGGGSAEAGVGQLWASPDSHTWFTLNANPMGQYPESATSGDVVDHEIAWSRNLGDPWRQGEPSAAIQAPRDSAPLDDEATPTATTEGPEGPLADTSPDRAVGADTSASGGGSASEIVLSDSWAHAPDSFAARPESISLGTSRWFDGLRWTGWGDKQAVGRGLEHFSDCGSCPESPGSPRPVTLVASDPGPCRGKTYYLTVLIKRSDGTTQTQRFRSPQFCGNGTGPRNPFYEATVRESGMTEAEVEAFFQRAVEGGRSFARAYGDYAGAQAACGRLVNSVLSGEAAPPEVAAMPPGRQAAALAALGQVAAQGCNYGAAEVSGR